MVEPEGTMRGRAQEGDAWTWSHVYELSHLWRVAKGPPAESVVATASGPGLRADASSHQLAGRLPPYYSRTGY